ncbi:DNA polymerase alpha subunit B [Yarrowia sp. E02]|nr:DNA polymerase alpha subunit B [Yarrowia sp. E02]
MTLSEKFGAVYDDNEELKKECANIMSIFNLSEEDLFIKWECFAINTNGDGKTDLDLGNLSKLKQYLLKEIEKAKKAKTTTPRPKMRRNREGAGELDLFDQLTNSALGGSAKRSAAIGSNDNEQTPVKKRPQPNGANGVSMSPPLSVTPIRSTPPPNSTGSSTAAYSTRKGAGTVLESLNSSIELNPGRADPGTKIVVSDHVQSAKYKYKTMYQKVSEASETLDEQIEQYMDWCVQKGLVKSNADFKNPSLSDQKSIFCAGRIVLDTPETVRLTDSSALLETPRSRGGALRVKLNLSMLPSVSLIPGQLVALKGVNSSGREVVVEEILKLDPPPFREVDSVPETPSLTQIIAAGPYTTTKDLDFLPLKDLLAQPADTFILLGPFIDSVHPLVAQGSFSVPGKLVATVEDLFRHKISPLLNACPAQIILIPSTRDSVSAHIAFPQPALARKALNLGKNVTCRTNPAQFSINELMFGTANLDIVRAVAQSELNKGNPEDFQARAGRYVVEQRSLYPLLPSPFAKQPGVAEDNQTLTYHHVDKAYLGLCDFVDVSPDIIIMPSQMQASVRVVSSVVVINPGYLTRMDSGGSYALLTTAPYTGGDAKAWERVRVDIKKI